MTVKPSITSADFKELSHFIAQFDESVNSLNFLGQNVLFLPKNTLSKEQVNAIETHSAVEKVVFPPQAYQLCSKEWRNEPTSFSIGNTQVGPNQLSIIAGPCAVESEEQIFTVAKKLAELNVEFIRGGAYKPRTSPYSFQGLETEGLKLIRKAADAYGLKVVTEVVDRSVLDDVAQYADVLQIGARNMQNFFLLKELGRIDKPIFLKRGMSAKIHEWLAAAEYIIANGNPRIILCERGIRTFDDSLRNTLDVAAIPLIKDLSHLPIFADPSHGTGNRKYIEPMAMAAVAAGADGIMVEVHPNPDLALSDGDQSIELRSLEKLLNSIRNLRN
ncbi:MAG: 3-deoxy-7-phosphoheptulonate synthase, partial [Bacteroidetes bacterium]|nr:3-deoxy-7-phosphoheptulonate synthase [Bacteroidota bacterium]